jgi:hypothetical protein
MNAMNRKLLSTVVVAGAAVAALASCGVMGGLGTSTTFFITSENPGQGGNLGGLAGADAWCEKLASAAGIGGRNWHAYLSTQATGGAQAVNARDRIGSGPWRNTKGMVVAYNLNELHGLNSLSKENSLTEKGEMVPTGPSGGDTVNKHDIITGSLPDGTAMPADRDATCSNWTNGSDQGGVMVGHHNRTGTNPNPVANISWNSSHITPGCSMPALAKTGGAGLMYCFAAR